MKKILVLTLVSLLLIQSSVVFALESDSSVSDGSVSDGSVTDESVYVNLDYNGEVKEGTVVSHVSFRTLKKELDIPLKLEDVVNLTSQSSLIYDNSMVKINAKEGLSDFYYETLMTSELPFDYNFTYKLDGSIISGEELAGKTGDIEIEISVTSNEAANQIYRESFMSQMTVTLNLESVSNIQVEDATQVVTGKSSKINFVTFPNSDAKYNLSFYGEVFEMESIMISLIPSSMSLPSNLEDQLEGMTVGFNDISTGIGEIKDGSVSLQNGLYDLSNGLTSLSSNVIVFNDQSEIMMNGIDQIFKGYSGVYSGVNELASNSSDLKIGLSALYEQGKELSDGLSLSSQGLSQLDDSSNSLIELAKSMLNHNDPLVVQMAEGIIKEQEAINQLSEKINLLDNGLNSYTQGVEALNNQYDLFDKGLSELSSGMGLLVSNQKNIANKLPNYKDGLSTITVNLDFIAKSTAEIPSQLDGLIEGQSALQEGVKTAADGIGQAVDGFSKEMSPMPSIVHDSRVESLQIFIKTPAIVYEEMTIVVTKVKKKESFFDRLINLFK